MARRFTAMAVGEDVSKAFSEVRRSFTATSCSTPVVLSSEPGTEGGGIYEDEQGTKKNRKGGWVGYLRWRPYTGSSLASE